MSSSRRSREPGCYTSNPMSRASCPIRVDVVLTIRECRALRRTGGIRRCLKERRSRVSGSSTPIVWSLTALGIYSIISLPFVMGMFDGTDRYRVDGNSESDAQRDARRSQEKAMTLTAHPLKKTRIYWTATRCALVGLGGHSGYSWEWFVQLPILPHCECISISLAKTIFRRQRLQTFFLYNGSATEQRVQQGATFILGLGDLFTISPDPQGTPLVKTYLPSRIHRTAAVDGRFFDYNIKL